MLVIIVIVVMMVVMFMLLFQKSFQFVIKGVLLCHCIGKLFACKLIPLGSNDGCFVVQCAEPCYDIVKSFLRNACGMAEDKAACISYLVVEELTEVLLIHSALVSVNNGGKAVENDIMRIDILNSLYNVAEFADTRWFNEYAVGLVGFEHLLECFTEVAHQ